MDEEQAQIFFEGVSPAEANRFAQELTIALLNSSPGARVERAKPDGATQDLGTIVSIVITSGAALALARGLADWLRLRRATITIRKGEVSAKGITGKEAVRIAEIFGDKNE